MSDPRAAGLTNAELLRIASARKPPQEWHNSEEDLFVSDPIRDDTTPAFEPSGKGPLTPSLDKWEPYPLPVHEAFQMPPPRATKPLFVPANICQRLVDSFGKTDAEFAEAFGVLQEFLEGGASTATRSRESIASEVVAAVRAGDKSAYDQAMARLAGSENTNSGARAPIQGE